MANKKTIVLLACSLAFVQLVAVCHAAEKQDLCLSEKVKLNSRKDLKRTTAVGCNELAVKALKDLKELVLGEKNICTMGKAAGITHYFETYLNEKSKRSLPRQLEPFAIAYGMQVNSKCKWYMTGDFYRKVDMTVYESEYDEVNQWTSDEGPIARILRSTVKQGEFLLPSDFEKILPKPEREALLEMGSVDEDKLIRVKDLCKNRFRKLYEPILLPIAHLDRNGLNYKSSRLAKHLALSTEVRKHNILWSRIVFLCETVKEMGDYNDEEMGPSKVKEIEEFHPHLEIGEEILDESDSSLKSAIKDYDLSYSELRRFKNRISDALDSLGHQGTAFLFEEAFGTVGLKGDELKASQMDLVSLLDPASSDKSKVILKITADGKKAGRKIASALETSKIMAKGIIAPKLTTADLHALKRDPKNVQGRDPKKSDMKNHSFRDA